MNSIWFYVALMLVAALVFVFFPLRGRRQRLDADTISERREYNKQAFRQRMEELETEHRDGDLSQEDFDRLSEELKLAFLRDMEELEVMASGRNPVFRGDRKWLPLAILVCIPVIAVFMYQRYGAAYDLAAPRLLEAVQQAETREEQETALRELASFLQGRLDRIPDDVRSGYMLGTLYMGLDNYDAAEETFRSLLDHVEEDADRATILGQLAQAQYLSAGESFTDEVETTISEALDLNANEQAVMSLLAVRSFIEGDVQEALSYWRRQLNQLNPGSREAQRLQQRINQVQAVLAEQQGGEAMAEQDAEPAAPSITVRVSLAPELRDRIESGMRVFVFARSTEMPMPLAARTFPVSELPLEVTLDDDAAMMAQATLSSASTVIVGARVSRSGEAIAQPGDFQVLSEPIELAEQSGPVTLEISDIVE